jgi:hypothetical protein
MKYTTVLCVGLLAGCTPAQQTAVDRFVVTGQLFCARATVTGPLVVALADAAGVPFTVTGKSAEVVARACAVIGAIPTTPPPNPGQAPVVAAPIVVAPVVKPTS